MCRGTARGHAIGSYFGPYVFSGTLILWFLQRFKGMDCHTSFIFSILLFSLLSIDHLYILYALPCTLWLLPFLLRMFRFARAISCKRSHLLARNEVGYGNGCKWLEITGNGWKWLEIASPMDTSIHCVQSARTTNLPPPQRHRRTDS